MVCRELKTVRGKEILEPLPCERFLQGFENSRAYLPPVSHREKREKYQNPLKNAQKAGSGSDIFSPLEYTHHKNEATQLQKIHDFEIPAFFLSPFIGD